MYAIYGNIYIHLPSITPNVSIYTIHGSSGYEISENRQHLWGAKPRWGGVVAEDGLHQLDMTGPFGLLQTKVRGKIRQKRQFRSTQKDMKSFEKKQSGVTNYEHY